MNINEIAKLELFRLIQEESNEEIRFISIELKRGDDGTEELSIMYKKVGHEDE